MRKKNRGRVNGGKRGKMGRKFYQIRCSRYIIYRLNWINKEFFVCEWSEKENYSERNFVQVAGPWLIKLKKTHKINVSMSLELRMGTFPFGDPPVWPQVWLSVIRAEDFEKKSICCKKFQFQLFLSQVEKSLKYNVAVSESQLIQGSDRIYFIDLSHMHWCTV